MIPNANGQTGATRIAVVHRAGGSLRCVVGSPAPGGTSATIAAWQEIPAGRTERLAAWLAAQGVSRVISVLPAAQVVCRTCLLPSTDAAHLEQALALQAEAHMPSDMPPHRQARAVLPMAAGETSRSGLLLWWPPGPAERDLPFTEAAAWSGPISYVPDVAALAALLNGRRPDGILLWFDRDDGSVGLAVSHSNGAVFRAARVGGSRLVADVGRVVAETALSVGHGPEFTQSIVSAAQRGMESVDRAAGLVAPPEVIESAKQRLRGAPDDPHWWRDYAVAAGALLAATGELASLTRFQPDAPVEYPSRLRRFVDSVSTTRGAIKAVAVSCAVVLFSPFLFAGLRLLILEMKLPDLKAALQAARESEAKLAVYHEMRTLDWPMSKLISDIACNTPEQIEVEQIRVRFGEPVTVSGRAKPDEKAKLSAQEVVTLMQDNLRKCGMFKEIHLNWGDPNNFGHYEFTLTAKVDNPYRPHDYPRELDYAAWTLAERLYGTAAASASPPPAPKPAGELARIDAEAPTPSDPAMDPDDPEGGEEPAAHGRVPRNFDPMQGADRDGDVGFHGNPVDRAVGGKPPSLDIPEPLTTEQIAAMSLTEAQEAYGHYSQAIQQGRIDPQTRQRLWADWKLLRDRVRELKAKQEKEGAP